MEIERANTKPLSPEEREHLETLKSVIEKVPENSEFSIAATDRIRSIIWAGDLFFGLMAKLLMKNHTLPTIPLRL